MLKPFSLGRKERLTNQLEFRQVLFRGTRLICTGFEIRVRDNTLEYPRLGISISRKLGNAPRRNSIKRKIREWFRTHKTFLKTSCDYIFLFKGKLEQEQVESLETHIREKLLETHWVHD